MSGVTVWEDTQGGRETTECASIRWSGELGHDEDVV